MTAFDEWCKKQAYINLVPNRLLERNAFNAGLTKAAEILRGLDGEEFVNWAHGAATVIEKARDGKGE